MIIELTKENFDEEVTNSLTPVLIKFWAEWCDPCKRLGPILDEVVLQFEGKNIKFASVEIDQQPEIATRYNVMGIPTLILVKDGEEIERAMGVSDASKDWILTILDKHGIV